MEKISNNAIINRAAIYGLEFAGICIAYTFIGKLLETGSFITGLAGSCLWLAKLVGLIWLMMWNMRKLNSDFSGVTRADLFRLGTFTALFSALLIAMWSYVDATFISAETMDAAFDQAIASYKSMLDSNSLKAVDTIKNHFSEIAFFSNLLYCTLYGIVLSAILSGKIISSNPFENTGTDEQ